MIINTSTCPSSWRHACFLEERSHSCPLKGSYLSFGSLNLLLYDPSNECSTEGIPFIFPRGWVRTAGQQQLVPGEVWGSAGMCIFSSTTVSTVSAKSQTSWHCGACLSFMNTCKQSWCLNWSPEMLATCHPHQPSISLLFLPALHIVIFFKSCIILSGISLWIHT